MSEHDQQAALFEWAKLQSGFFGELAYMFAIPNGGKLPYTRDAAGRVISRQRIFLTKEGMRPGVPDIFLPCPRGEYHGLFIEMKYGNNKPENKQVEYLEFLVNQGYYVCVCWSWDLARQVILWYFELPKPKMSKGVIKILKESVK